MAILLENHLDAIDDESLSTVLYEAFNAEEELVKDEENDYVKYHEKLIQENTNYRKLYEACSDLLDLPDENPKSAQKYFLIYITCLLCQKPM